MGSEGALPTDIDGALLLLPFLRADIVVVVGVTARRIEGERERASFVFCLSSPFSSFRWPAGRVAERPLAPLGPLSLRPGPS